MKKGVKITCLVAVSCIVLGLLIILGTSFKIGFDYNQLNTGTLETNTYTVEQPFQNIDIQSRWSNVYFAVAQNAQCEVVCTETERKQCVVSVENGTLTVSQKDTRRWYECFGIFWGPSDVSEMKITVYLPQESYQSLRVHSQSGDVSVGTEFAFQTAELQTTSGNIQFLGSVKEQLAANSNSGNITVENVNVDMLQAETTSGNLILNAIQVQNGIDLKATSGNLKMGNVTAQNLTAETTSGNITLNTVQAKDKLDLEASSGTVRLENAVSQELVCATTSGDVRFQDSDAHSITVSSTSGCVEGNLRTAKNFEISTTSGDMDVPYSDSGADLCQVTTTSGDVSLRISEP